MKGEGLKPLTCFVMSLEDVSLKLGAIGFEGCYSYSNKNVCIK